MTSNPDDKFKYLATIGDLLNNKKMLFLEYLNLLGLTEKFPKKLTIKDAIVIRNEILGNIADTDKIETLPYLILQKVMMFDTKYRSSLYKGKAHSRSFLGDLDKIHPLDTFVTLLHCCNNFLTQDLLTRLSTCQLAIPFLLPNPYDGSIMYLLWGMREIIQSWKCTDSSGVLISNKCRIVDYPAPIVSFYKIGKILWSKSKIINEIISESKVDFFFNWDCDGGTLEKYFVDGMVELSCYLPSGRNDFYSDIIIFSNLRGDPRRHTKQLNFMQNISCISCVLLQEKDLDDEAIQLLEKLIRTPGGLILMFADLKDNETLKNKKLMQQLGNMCTIKMKEKNFMQIRTEVRKEIVMKLNSTAHTHHKNLMLSKCEEIAQSLGIQLDENDEGCKEGKKLAKGVMHQIASLSLSTYKAKLKIFPLQGPDLWHKWAVLNKESYQKGIAKDIETKKKTVRQNQLNFAVKPTLVMETFLSNLLNHSGNVRLYFLYWFKVLLYEHTQEVLPSLKDAYQKAKDEFLNIKPEYNLQKQVVKDTLKLLHKELVNASFGIEHFIREMGQMYEARMDTSTPFGYVSRDLEIFSFPQIVAELMTEGYPVELMDGDATHVPITWVLAVMDKLKIQYLQNQNIFVVSVLGIQSTGKSTLLNSIFGLHFDVGAGCCTRGAYFQLLPLNSALQKETGCHHILIVDTEGLRASEFQKIKSQMHDNELATFVIGLADLTIINIYGEKPGEIADIIQTAFHAFIRMKNVDIQPSCLFVHHNVAEVMENDKTKLERQSFLDRLNSMINKAAKIERGKEKYEAFQDVIQFNAETNVILFPSLWKGDPPMAPIDPVYNFKANTLKKAIITTLKGKYVHSNFTTFSLRVKKLWSAVLQEQFVFSFKNVLDVAAYNELTTQYYQWSWNLHHKFLAWQVQAENQINSCNILDVDCVVDNCLVKFDQDLNNIYLQLNQEVIEFFVKNRKLVQWHNTTEVKLTNLYEEHKDDARKHCNILRQNRKGQIKIQIYHQRLQDQVIALASDIKTAALSPEKHEEIFNQHWQQWIKELSETNKPVIYTAEHYIEQEIFTVLLKNYNSHSQLVVQALQYRSMSQGGTLKLKINSHLHLDSNRWINRLMDWTGLSHINPVDLHEAQVQTERYFHEVKELMESTMERCQDFSKTLVSNWLMQMQKSIENFNNEKKNFTFTPHYQVDMAITVAGYAYQQFNAKLKQLAIENNLVESMNQLKPIFLRTFETQFLETNDQIAAQNLCNILTKSIKKSLIEKLSIEIVASMKRVSSHFLTRRAFKVLVLKDLAVAQDFELFKMYLRNIDSSLQYWSKIYVKQHCEIMNNRNTLLFNLAQKNLNGIFADIFTALNENSPPSEDSYQNFWINHFHKRVGKFITINLQEVKSVIKVDHVYNQKLFTRHLVTYLRNECESILVDFKNTNASIAKLIESTSSPHMILYKSLIGCKEQCPFCNEECDLADENHLKSGTPHFTHIHRPQCLSGLTRNSKLVFETCIQAIQGDGTFRNSDTNNKFHPYKEYKMIYPNLSILIDSPDSKYWKWFIAKYNFELAEWNEAHATLVNEVSWQRITKDEAISSLDEHYDYSH